MSKFLVETPTNCNLLFYESVGSTNEEAKRLAVSGVDSGTVVWAREQLSGKGRHGRTWSSPPGNLYASIVQRPSCKLSEGPQIGFVTSVSLIESIQSLTGINATLKWPNDLLINEKKVAGILLESFASENDKLDWIIIGVGVNIMNCPSDIKNTTCLYAEGGKVSVETLLQGFLVNLYTKISEWDEHGFERVRNQWMMYAPIQGSRVRVRLPIGEVTGKYCGLDSSGNLIIETEKGIKSIETGEVFPVVSNYNE